MSTPAETTHSKIGASSMDRWSECPGSVRESAGMPNTESEAAKAGTYAHEVAADKLKGKDYPANISEEMRTALNMYVNHLHARWKSFPRNNENKWFVERKFNLQKIYPNLFGTADSVMYDASTKTLYVDDLKYGSGLLVEAEGNVQLRYYGLGAWMDCKLDVETVVLTIVQPRYGRGTDEPITSETLGILELMDFAGDLREFAEATTKPDAPLKSGDHCRFCPANQIEPGTTTLKCPLLKQEVASAVDKAFSTSMDDVQNMPTETLGELLSKLDSVERWCKTVREHAYSQAKKGVKVPGYKLVAKRASRYWIASDKALAAIQMSFVDNVASACMTDPELKSPAQVEAVLGKGQKGFIESLCTKISTGDVLVTEDDNRPAVTGRSASDMFDELTENK